MSTRATIIGTLFTVEVALFGAILYFLGGAPTHAAAVNIGGGRVVDVVDAGSAPHIVVSDPDSRVVLIAASDGRIRITDRSSMYGWTFGGSKTIAPVRVVRTSDGLRIERAKYSNHFMLFGGSRQRIEIAAPPQSTLDVTDSSGTEVSGVRGTIKIHSQDGRITLRDIGSAVDAQTDDGRIELDGTCDPNGIYTLRTADGRIRINATCAAALQIHALTADGSIRIDGHRVGDNGESQSRYDADGTAAGRLSLETQDGSIAINTLGVK